MFEGKKQAFIGIGGGSDCIQASILASLYAQHACVISIRRNKLGSQGGKDDVGGDRSVHNHGGELSGKGQGVFRITPETTGSGRFLEFLPARNFPTYLVIDSEDGRLAEQIEAVTEDFGGVDSIIGVDTGGDALYRTHQAEDIIGKTTPDQDIASLLALSEIKGPKLYSAIIAKGVDSPDYADDILAAAEAKFITLNDGQIENVMDIYESFDLTGKNPERYGKTPFAWQAALRGEFGKVSIPLPKHLINHPTNPWNPVVNIDSDGAGIYIMDLDNHVRAITAHEQKIQPEIQPDFDPN